VAFGGEQLPVRSQRIGPPFFFFALGGAGALYIEYRLIPNIMHKEDIRIYLAMLLGFYMTYFAALLHE